VYVYGGEPFRRVRAFRRVQRSAEGLGGACGAGAEVTSTGLRSRPKPDRPQLLYAQRLPSGIRARRGVRWSSIQTRNFRQRGTVASTKPDQNVAGRPS
jgi:hypothetical protein